MPRKRPMAILRRLGIRIRTRRKAIGRTMEEVAKTAGISSQQLNMYETGQGHPPVGTWMRIADALGTTAGTLLGEREKGDTYEVDLLMKLYNDRYIGGVTRYMQDMSLADRKLVHVLSSAMANRPKDQQPPERADVMRVSQ